MEKPNRRKTIEELQMELAIESEALAALQTIYAEKVKQVRTNTTLPPDIQARFLREWETFYQQRLGTIFKKSYKVSTPPISVAAPTSLNFSSAATTPALFTEATPDVVDESDIDTTSVVPEPSSPPPVSVQASQESPKLSQEVEPVLPKASKLPPVPPPIPTLPPLPTSASADLPTSDEMLGMSTDSWMNPVESIAYEQYNEQFTDSASGEVIENGKLQESTDDVELADGSEFSDDQENMGGFAATSGLKGLTGFMDFNLKKKR